MLTFEIDKASGLYVCRGEDGCGARLEPDDVDLHKRFHTRVQALRVMVEGLLAAKRPATPPDADEVRRKAIEGAW